ASSAAWVLGKGLSPICSSMTSLPCALRRLATASTSKAVSELRPWAKQLREGRVIKKINHRDTESTEKTKTEKRKGTESQCPASAFIASCLSFFSLLLCLCLLCA